MLQDIRVRQRDLLLQLIRLMTRELDLDTLLGQILKISIEILSGTSGFIALNNPTTGWVVKAASGMTGGMVKYIETYLEYFPTGDLAGSDSPIEIDLLIDRVRNNPDFNGAEGLGVDVELRGDRLVRVPGEIRYLGLDFVVDVHQRQVGVCPRLHLDGKHRHAVAGVARDRLEPLQEIGRAHV